jgi:hypothetical protein
LTPNCSPDWEERGRRTASWQQIRIWGVQDRRSHARTARPWVVRWAVDARERGKAFKTKDEAEAFRSELLIAKRNREPFDPNTAEPLSWSPSSADLKVHVWARRWLAEQWPEWQPRTRTSAIEALTRFIPLVTASRADPAPNDVRSYLTTTLVPGADVDADHPHEQWLDRSMCTLTALNRELLATVDAALGVGVAGKPLSPATAGRYRKVARACLRRAVELDILDRDPWPPAPKAADIAGQPASARPSTYASSPTRPRCVEPSTRSPPTNPAATPTRR